MATPTITPATPEVTINNSAAEIKAAMESQAAPADPTPQPAVATAPPATPEPYTVTETPEGVEIKLETGAVYKGKNWQEAALAAAKGKVEADKYLHSLKIQQPQTPAPATPAPPAEDPTDLATRQWIVSQMAAALGVPADKFVEMTSQMFQQTQQNTLAVAWADFTQSCPDYADTPDNANALVEYLPQDVVAQNRPPSAQELKNAHAIALYNKRYQAAQVSANTPQTPHPPVMPTASGVQPGDPDPYKIPLAELKKQAFGQ
jgi:hypothetical protein